MSARYVGGGTIARVERYRSQRTLDALLIEAAQRPDMDPAVLEAIAIQAAPRLISQPERLRVLLGTLNRAPGATTALRVLLAHADAAAERVVAAHPTTPDAILAKLSYSKRKRTIQLLFEREMKGNQPLPAEACVGLCQLRDEKLRMKALGLRNTPTATRQEAAAQGIGPHAHWSTYDPDFAILHCRALLAVSALGWFRIDRRRQARTFSDILPRKDLPEDLVGPVREMLSWAHDGTLVSHARHARGNLLGLVVQAAGTRSPDVIRDVASAVCARAPKVRHEVPPPWPDAPTLTLAWEAGGALAASAVAHPDAPAAWRQVAVENEQLHFAVAHNPHLTPNQIGRLIQELDARDYWRLMSAYQLDEWQARCILDSGNVAIRDLLAYIDKRGLASCQEQYPRMFDLEVLRYSLALRDTCVPYDKYSAWAKVVLQIDPQLIDDVLANLTQHDEIDSELGADLANATLPNLTADSAAHLAWILESGPDRITVALQAAGMLSHD